MKTAFVNGVLYTGDAVLRNRILFVEDGVISGISAEMTEAAEVIDLKGALIAPGFIDIQVNGGGGVLFNDEPAVCSLETMSRAHERFGTLYFCPTVISAELEVMERALCAVREAQGKNIGVLGAHLEGPYLSLKRPGVHDRRFIRAASDYEINRILASGEGLISLITVAPESVAEEQIRRLADSGIKVFLGHTDASFEQACGALRAGACGATHLYNAMSQLTGREPGVAGAVFCSKDVWAGIIADGIHVDWNSIKIAKELKGPKLLLVTDAMPPVGKPDAVYTIGGNTISCVNGRCATADGTLAGSALDMASAVRNSVSRCGIALDEALRMASLYPAQMLGLCSRLGYIREGYGADLVILNSGIEVEGIIRTGKLKTF